MASEFYGYFDSVAGDEREYDAAKLAHMLRGMARNGITSHENGGLEVTAQGGSMCTVAQAGGCMINGYLYVLGDDGGAAKTFIHAAAGASDRIDRVVARLELTSDQRKISLCLLTGTSGVAPTPPALTRNQSTYEMALAQVRVRGGAESVEAADITDERADESVCGYAVPARLGEAALNTRYAGHSAATPSASGLMSAADKSKLNGIAAGARAGAIVTAATLAVAGWVGSAAPYTQSVSVAGMTASKNILVGLSGTATAAQREAAAVAGLSCTAQGTGTVTVTAYGTKPTVALPMILMEV